MKYLMGLSVDNFAPKDIMFSTLPLWIYYELINSLFPENEYFDFGTSNENAGWYLNVGMSAHKEEFGGRGIAYDIYEINI